MELTNEQIETAKIAIERFNPKCSVKTKLRLARNHRKLTSAWNDKEHERVDLLWRSVGNQDKRPDNPANASLTPAEQQRFLKEYRVLMEQKVTVDIHPIELCDTEDGPGASSDCYVDISKNGIPNDILGMLVDAGILTA